MNVFIDTEFSSLGSDPRLISIALVAENGAELYIEFQSGWKLEQCSSWVKSNVLPLLGSGEKLDRRAAALRINNWLSQYPSLGRMIVDSSWDAELISDLFIENGLENCIRRLKIIPFPSQAESAAFEAVRQQYFLDHQCPNHHALHDARAIRFACWELNREITESGVSRT